MNRSAMNPCGRRTARAAATGILLACLLAAGCGEPVTVSRYERIAQGMSIKDVEQILGRGTPAAGGVVAVTSARSPAAARSIDARRVLMWEQGSRRITIAFRDGKVVSKHKQGF